MRKMKKIEIFYGNTGRRFEDELEQLQERVNLYVGQCGADIVDVKVSSVGANNEPVVTVIYIPEEE